MVSKRDSDGLPTSSYAILGLVSFAERSGYDLKRFADISVKHFFWSPARSQIYAELRRLESLGFVAQREVEQKRRPDKRLYKITPEGREALQRWLVRPELGPEVLKSSLMLNLFFARLMPIESIIDQLERYREGLKGTIAEFEVTEGRIKDSEEYFFPYLTLKCGIAREKASLAWAEEALEQLRQKNSQVRELVDSKASKGMDLGSL